VKEEGNREQESLSKKEEGGVLHGRLRRAEVIEPVTREIAS